MRVNHTVSYSIYGQLTLDTMKRYRSSSHRNTAKIVLFISYDEINLLTPGSARGEQIY